MTIPFNSEELGTIGLQLGELRLTATIFRTPDGFIAVFIELPEGCSLESFASAQPNTRIRDKAVELAGQPPDFYELRYRAPA